MNCRIFAPLVSSSYISIRAGRPIRKPWISAQPSRRRKVRSPSVSPLGDDRDLECVSKTDDGAHDRRRLGIGIHAGHEALVDLDLVERERLQRRHRRIAGAEIVHGYVHAESLQPAQGGKRARRVIEDDAFGDLQLQARRRQPRVQEDHVHEAGQIAVTELHRRKVHADLQRGGPGCRLAACSAHAPMRRSRRSCRSARRV